MWPRAPLRTGFESLLQGLQQGAAFLRRKRWPPGVQVGGAGEAQRGHFLLGTQWAVRGALPEGGRGAMLRGVFVCDPATGSRTQAHSPQRFSFKKCM